MKKYALSELVLDFDLYPRGSVDMHHAGEIADAIQAGAAIPPIVIDKKSKRVADGFHRWKAYRRLFGEDHKVDCVEKDYKDDAELFVDAMRFNASHGRALTIHDKTHCLILAEKLGIGPDLVTGALNITTARIGQLRTERIGKIGPANVALKQTIRHMAGKSLTVKQGEANDKLSGMNQMFYVNQLITLIENDLIDEANVDLADGLRRLRKLLDRFERVQAA